MILVDRVIAERGDAYQDRALVDLPNIFRMEDDGVCDVFRLWRELRLRSPSMLPKADDLRWQPIVDMGMQLRVSVVDVGEDEPDAYFMKMQSHMSFQYSGHNLQSVRFGEFTDRLHFDALAEDYMTVKRRGQPRYHHIHNKVDGRWRTYRRLMLPLAGADGRTVESILVALREAAPELPPR